jgi:uncharacterized protein with HEPN domain
MSERDLKVYLQDILDSIQIIEDYLENKTEFDFEQSLLLQDAVIRRFEIIGEAAAKIPTDFRQQNTGVEWVLMKDMRNKLIHEYYGVSTSTIYNTAKRELPKLKEELLKILHR